MRYSGLIILFFSSLLFASCLKDGAFKEEYSGFVPVSRNDGIEVSSPENESMDASLLEDAFRLVHDDDRFVMARSLLVFRNGKLVAEAYPDDPDDIDRLYNIQSCTKSITSLLVGIAIQEGKIDSLNERLFEIYPEYFDDDSKKRFITIEDALIMQTGLEFDNSEHTLELYQTEGNSTAYVLSQDYMFPSGTVTNYNDGAPQLISKVIEKKTGLKASEYAREKLFNPLGITDWIWEEAHDETTYGAFSLFLKPRDLGKIGELLLQNGKYNNQAIVDSSYLLEATSIKVSTNFNSEPYGYYFWILPAYDAYAALGHGGQFLFVAPQEKLVVVYTAWPYTSDDFFDQRNDLMALIWNSCK